MYILFIFGSTFAKGGKGGIRQWDNTPNLGLYIPYTISGPVLIVSLGLSLKVYMASIVSGRVIHIVDTMYMYN